MTEQRPRQRSFAPRSRQGCLTCRRRRKRCDQQEPKCGACVRLNLVCEWQEQRQIVKRTVEPSPREEDSTSPETEAAVTCPNPLRTAIDPWENLPHDGVAEAKHLLQYYIEAFVPSISVATTRSSFYTALYIPMAAQSERMLNAILALSSAQLARRASDPVRAHHLREVSSRRQAKCLQFLRPRLAPNGMPLKGLPLRDLCEMVGVTLMLVGLDALNGNKTPDWLVQLQSARATLDMLYQQNNMISWEILDCLRRHFTYYDVMASLMAGVTRSPRAPLQRTLTHAHSPGNGLCIDPLMGISDQLCSLVCRIQLVSTPTPAFPHFSKAHFDVLERDIQNWSYENPLLAPDIETPLALDLIALAEAYRKAALIQLYRTSEVHRLLIPALASQVMQCISRIPLGSPAESSLLYPMFLAGAELTTEKDIAMCFERLTAIQKRNRYENIANLRDVLQEIWTDVLNGLPKRDWEDVLRELGWSFSLA
ncbi:putative Zn(II)2Cys6 transcription factor-like protein [Sporormia fimetaria CBS 119925]|uniref:Zn(II)2Cys6 transcription factor-like protein n=1 Tax=Sporormia fimetaria CBS 119925 TaxID=1340428 RepID=A0A6A6UYM4_9PLEO|nr:putative Zn(II)2Cys6 transcription factor-like protein [Sporormia fimetaria CBS 119925]